MKKVISIISFIIILTPLITSAAVFIPCQGTAADPCDFNAFAKMINTIINWFISMAGVVAVITFSIAGIQMLMNPENPGKREQAIEMFKKTIIGLLIVLIAWLVVHTIISTLVNPNINALRFLK